MSDAQPVTRRPGSEAIPGLPTERFNRRTILILVGASLMIGLIVVFGTPKILEHNRTLKVRELTSKASKHLANGEWDSAAQLLREAYQIDPRHPETQRLMAKSLEQVPGGTPAAAYFWRQLIETHEATTEDTAAYATILLRIGLREEAKKFFDAIPPAERATRPALELEAAFLKADGQPDMAEKLLRAAYLADSGNPESQLKLAALDLNSPFVEVQESAAEKLWQIARSGGSEALNAMRMLAGQAKLGVAQAVALRKLLEKIPDASDERRLAIVSGILRALPAERESIIAAEAARQQDRPFEKTATFIKWLAANNEHKRLLSLLPAAQAIRSADLFLPYVAAMEYTHRWKELRELISKYPSIPISPAAKSLILARCSHSLKESSELVHGHLQEALQRAWVVKDRPTMLSIGSTADEFGQPDVALEAFNLLSSQPQFKLPMLERMLMIRQRQHDLPAMIELTDRCLKEQPNDPAYIEIWCYLKLLEGSEMEKAADTIRRLIEANPSRLPSSFLVKALAAYRYGDLESAEREAKSVVASRLPPGQRAVLAGIFHACGRERDAFQVAEKVPDAMVLVEEERFLKTAF